MTEYGDAFAWMTKDPRWIGKVLVVGLIGLIPIVGQMNLMGWTLASLDNLRAGRLELAAANFSHLGRGARLFLVQLVYVALLLVVGGLFFGPGTALLVLNPNSAGPAGLGVVLTMLGALVIFVVALGYAWVQPIVYLRTDGGGIGAGLDIPAVLASLRAQPLNTLLAALLMAVGGFIGGLGVYACLVGAIFTVPYGYAIVAAVLGVYEQQAGRPAPQPI